MDFSNNNMTEFDELGDIPGIGPLQLKQLSHNSGGDMLKAHIIGLAQKNGMDKIYEPSEHIRQLCGIDNHKHIGVTKMADYVVIWKEVDMGDGVPQRVIIGIAHSDDLNSHRIDSTTPVNMWRVRYRDNDKTLQIEDENSSRKHGVIGVPIASTYADFMNGLLQRVLSGDTKPMSSTREPYVQEQSESESEFSESDSDMSSIDELPADDAVMGACEEEWQDGHSSGGSESESVTSFASDELFSEAGEDLDCFEHDGEGNEEVL